MAKGNNFSGLTNGELHGLLAIRVAKLHEYTSNLVGVLRDYQCDSFNAAVENHGDPNDDSTEFIRDRDKLLSNIHEVLDLIDSIREAQNNQ